MSDERIKERIRQTVALRATCQAIGDYEGYLAHDRQIGILDRMLVANMEKRSVVMQFGCRQMSR